VNSLNASLVLMTADHGFLYQESPLDDAEQIDTWRQARWHAESQEALPARAGDR
jgi:hypothetical protein